MAPRGQAKSDRAFVCEGAVQRCFASKARVKLAELRGEILHLRAWRPEGSFPAKAVALSHCLALENMPVRVSVVVY